MFRCRAEEDPLFRCQRMAPDRPAQAGESRATLPLEEDAGLAHRRPLSAAKYPQTKWVSAPNTSFYALLLIADKCEGCSRPAHISAKQETLVHGVGSSLPTGAGLFPGVLVQFSHPAPTPRRGCKDPGAQDHAATGTAQTPTLVLLEPTPLAVTAPCCIQPYSSHLLPRHLHKTQGKTLRTDTT